MNRSRFALRPLFLLLPAVLGGCSLIPPHLLPEFALPAQYREQQAAQPTPAEAEARRAWKEAGAEVPAQAAPWQLFALPELPELLQRQEKANASLAVAKARYDQAAALVAQANAGLFPTLNANAGTTRARSNGAVGNTANLGLSSAWEIDLWGRLRAGAAASEASAEASAADYAGVRLALQAQLVQALLALRVVDIQRQLLDATVADYQRYVRLTGDRVRFGVASQADLAQAETQLRGAQAQAIDTGVQRAQLEHAIAVLVGELPANFQLPATAGAASVWRAPLRATAEEPSPRQSDSAAASHAALFELAPALPVIPLSAPSTLLERRPDIAAAERRVAAANAAVGVARAAFFPVLNLAASAGGRSAAWSDIFSAPARVWSIGPALAAPLFDAGLRRAQKAEAVAAWEQSTATYRQTVLAAFQEVEDQLAALRIQAEEAEVQAQAVQAARRSADLVFAQYRAGTASSLQVITANNALLAAERTALDLHARRLTAAVTLVRALGGGWQP